MALSLVFAVGCSKDNGLMPEGAKLVNAEFSIAVDDTKKAMSVIYRLTGSSAMNIENGKIILRSQSADSGAINKALVENGVTVFELNRQSGDLESYFLERTGGKNG